MLPFIVDSVQTIGQRAWKWEGAPKFWLNFTGLLSDETKPIMKGVEKKRWSCASHFGPLWKLASCVAVANVEILWNARRRQKASASAPQCTSKKTTKKGTLSRGISFNALTFMLPSKSRLSVWPSIARVCALPFHQAPRDISPHGEMSLFLQCHTGLVSISTWSGTLKVRQNKNLICCVIKWFEQKKRH